MLALSQTNVSNVNASLQGTQVKMFIKSATEEEGQAISSIQGRGGHPHRADPLHQRAELGRGLGLNLIKLSFFVADDEAK